MKLCRCSLSLHANQKHAKFEFEMPTLVFAGYQFQWVELQTLQQIVASGLGRDTILSYFIHAKYRPCRSKGRSSKSVLPKADKAEAEGCQDPRQLFFSSWEKCQS